MSDVSQQLEPRIPDDIGPPVDLWPGRRPTRWASLVVATVPLAVACIGILVATRPAGAFNPGYSFALFNTLLLGVPSFAVAILALRSHLERASCIVYLMGLGTLSLGLGAIFAGFRLGGSVPGAIPALYNSLALLSGLLHLSSVAMCASASGAGRRGGRLAVALGGYAGVVLAAVVLLVLVRNDLWPRYFLQGVGATPLGKGVAWSAAGVFGVSAILLALRPAVGWTYFRLFYSVGLGLICVGLAGVAFQHSLGDAVNWASRAAQYLGGVSLVVAVVPAARGWMQWLVSVRHRLDESEHRYKKLVDLNPEGIVVIAKGRIVAANPAAAALFGASSERVLKSTPLDRLLDGDALSAMDPEPEQARKSHATAFQTFEIRGLDGVLRSAEMTSARVNYGGRPSLLLVFRDVTGRQRSERELRQAEEQLRQSQKMEAVGQLAGGIAHDFNNLLGVILGYAEVLSESADLQTSESRKDLEEIRRAGERAATLTKQILAFSRRQPMRPEKVRLNDLLEELAPMLRRILGEDLQLVTRLDPGLGYVRADRHQLEQVVTNLVLNARDAMPGGGVLTLGSGSVSWAMNELGDGPGSDEHFAVLSVSDTGVGMDRDTASRAFEPFFTTKEPGKGTGLGLSVVYGIVQQSGGHVELSSEPGEGTRVDVYLPLVEAEDARGAGPLETSQVTGQGQTIILAEDEAQLRVLMVRYLSGLGYRVLAAADADEAQAIARSCEVPPDLLVTDVILPGSLRGDGLARKILEQFPGIPVLFISGYPSDFIGRSGALDEGTTLLQKPFRPEVLGMAVRQALADRPVAGS